MIPATASYKWRYGQLGSLLFTILLIGGCAMKSTYLEIEGLEQQLAVGSIFDTARNESIDFETLIDQLAEARVVYVGERHTASAHHQVQLKVIKALVDRGLTVRVGMEMFDHTYQERLDEWSSGRISWETFLERSHWYANWKFDDTLYKDILQYVKEKQLKLVGLNVPFHLPRKIAVGGLENLLDFERKQLPAEIDTTDTAHRAYVEEIFKMHKIKGRNNFEYFYAAQCTWEDGMAQAVAENLGNDTMVVIAGNGHIIRKYGIPKRAYKRSKAPYRTVYLSHPGMAAVSLEDGDYIWVTDRKAQMPPMGSMPKPGK